MPTVGQLQKIHIARKQAGVSEDNYRAMLSGFRQDNGLPVTSSTQLDNGQVFELLRIFEEKLGWKPAPMKKGRKKFVKRSVPGSRPEEFASAAQIEKINALWVLKSRAKDKESLRLFVKRITGVDSVDWLLKEQVSKIIKAIEELK